MEIVTIKGIFSGLGSLIVALLLQESFPSLIYVAFGLILGFFSYGLSILFYILAQKDLGAAKTSAYYSIAPFLGAGFGLLLGERPAVQFYIALAIMVVSAVLMVKDTISLQHTHLHNHTHIHEHFHDGVSHTHEHTHSHEHTHIHGENCEGHSHNHSDMDDHNHTH